MLLLWERRLCCSWEGRQVVSTSIRERPKSATTLTPLASGLHGAPRNSSLWSVLGTFSRSAANFDRILTEPFKFKGATSEGVSTAVPELAASASGSVLASS
jgi:hypothetical protein